MRSDNLANRIYELRKSKELSQKELGALVGVSNKAVSKWETGAAVPKTEILLKLAEIFDINAQEFLENAVSEDASQKVKSRTLSDVARETDEILRCEKVQPMRVTVLFSRKRAKVYLISLALLVALSLWLARMAYSYMVSMLPGEVNLASLTAMCVMITITLPSLFTGLWYAAYAIRRIPFWMRVLCVVAWLFVLYFSLLAGLFLLLPSIGIAIVQCFRKGEGG